MTLQIAIVDAANPPPALVKVARKSQFEWGEQVGNYKVFACHAAQLDILRSKAKFTFAFAGSGGGKTCLIGLWLFKQIQKNPQGRFLVVSPSLSTFDSSQLKQHLLNTFDGTPYQGRWHEQRKTYVLPTGGEIVVKTVNDGNDYQKLIGGQYDAAVADECYELSKAVWDQIRLRVSNKNGPVLGVTTPTGNNWIWDAKEAADKGDKDYYVRHWAKTDNPTVNAEDVERERTLLGEAVFRRQILGEFATLDGLVYGSFSDAKSQAFPVVQGDPAKGLPSKAVRFFGGVDWGYHPDPAAVLMFAECENGVTYVVDEICQTKLTHDVLAVKLRDLKDKWATEAAPFVGYWADRSRPEAVEVIRRGSVPIRNNRVKDILAGVQTTDSWFNAGRLKVYATCTNLVRELRGYQWNKDNRGGFKDSPIGRNDHTCDALRYGVSSQKYGQRITPLSATAQEVGEPTQAEAAKDMEAERENRRFFLMAMADLDD